MISDPETGSTDPWLEEASNVISKVSVQAQPRVLIELNRIARQPDVCFESVADLVVKDVGLCAKLLKLASSPMFSNGQRFDCVQDALMTIGFQEFRRCFLSVSIECFISKVGYPYRGFWDHSMRVASFCQVLAERFSPQHAFQAYTLGLFHDVGAVLIPMYNKSYADHIARALPLYFGITELEYALVKTNHCAVGELFARNWSLSEDILIPLRHHHNPNFDEEWSDTTRELKAILQLAELINDKIEKKSDTYTPFSQSKDTLVRICGVLGFGPQVLPELEQDLLAALEGDK